MRFISTFCRMLLAAWTRLRAKMTGELPAPGITDDLDSLLPTPFVDASEKAVAACKEEQEFTILAHGLYREAGAVICVSSCAVASTGRLPRNQAICAGLLVRITKFMIAIAQLTLEEDRREVVTALSRCILESATNLRYLIHKNDNALYDAFIRSGLGPQREAFDKITENIKARGGKSEPIEERMLEMTMGMCAASGLRIDDVPPNGGWGGGMRQNITELGLPEYAYSALQRYPSHAVHGTWVDLVTQHLEAPAEGEEGFKVKTAFSPTDERDFGPVALYALDSTRDYLEHYFNEVAQPLLQRIDDLQTRIRRVMQADEKQVQRRRGQEPEGLKELAE